MYKLKPLEGWNKPTTDEELFERAKKVDSILPIAIKSDRTTSKFGLGILGGSGGLLTNNFFHWLSWDSFFSSQNFFLEILFEAGIPFLIGLPFGLWVGVKLWRLASFAKLKRAEENFETI